MLIYNVDSPDNITATFLSFFTWKLARAFILHSATEHLGTAELILKHQAMSNYDQFNFESRASNIRHIYMCPRERRFKHIKFKNALRENTTMHKIML